MTPARKLLLESLAGHLALLCEVHPRKAAAPIARRTRALLRINGVGVDLLPKRAHR